MSIRSKIQALITAANAKTGESDTTLTDAVQTLVDGYGQGGGGGITPSGTKQISIVQNGTTTEDVTQYANAEIAVNVPTGITPSGTKQISITQNGTTTEDVTQYANAEITVNVPSGGSLPSVISKIDGGSFTLASDTAGTSHWISHNLGELPKGIIVWTDDADLRTSTAAVAQRYLLCSQLVLMDWVTGTTSNAMIPNHMFRNTNGATSNTGSPIAQSAVWNYIQTTRFNNALGAAYYKAGVEYKWIAWA